MSKAAFGVIGLGTMGRNLALNIESRGVSVAVWNRELEWTEAFVRRERRARRFTGTASLEALVAAVEHPRRILMMIPAGAPVDEMIGRLRPLLQRGDVLIDGGNSWFEDTARREAGAARRRHPLRRLRRVGRRGRRAERSVAHARRVGRRLDAAAAGARGDRGADRGRSVRDARRSRRRRTFRQDGPQRHRVRRHAADRRELGPDAPRLRHVGRRDRRRLRGVEPGPARVVPDRALGAGLPRHGSPSPGSRSSTSCSTRPARRARASGPCRRRSNSASRCRRSRAALDARVLSSLKDERVAAAQSAARAAHVRHAAKREKRCCAICPAALYASRICVYAQGLALISAASRVHEWRIDIAEVARIWKAGCIIRARLLDPLRQAFSSTPGLAERAARSRARAGGRRCPGGVATGGRAAAPRPGIPLPAHATALAYFDSYRSARLPQNLTQAQRDAFGAHTYERIDQPGKQHSDW